MTINTRADLDAAAGTAEYEAFLRGLEGSLWRVEAVDGAWVTVEDDSTVARFGFARGDFPDATPPALPTTPPPAQTASTSASASVEIVNHAQEAPV